MAQSHFLDFTNTFPSMSRVTKSCFHRVTVLCLKCNYHKMGPLTPNSAILSDVQEEEDVVSRPLNSNTVGSLKNH